MGRHRRIASIALVVATTPLLLAIGGCGRTPAPPPPGVTSTTTSVSVPVDRLAPGEAPPGVEKAFDVILPRGSRIEGRFADSVHAIVPLTVEDAANYVRKQADDQGSVVVGPNGTVFEGMKIAGADPGHHLRIEISAVATETQLVIERIEEKPPPEKLPNDEAMKKAGLTPEGKLLDPNHTQ